MNEIETFIAKLEKRIKKMVENPDPNRLRCNKLRYEISLSDAKARLEAWKQGKPFSDGGGGFSAGILTQAMGFAPTGGLEAAFQTNRPERYIELAASRGLPTEASCDMTMLPFAMAELGEVPLEDLSVCDQHACTPMMLRGIYVAHATKIRTFYLDIPFEQNEASIKHVANQLGEFIEFCEKNYPGVKFSEDKLIELLEKQEEYEGYCHETYQMLKNRPSPLGGMDVIQLIQGTGYGGSIDNRLEYARIRRDEVAERVAKGISAVEGEKLRMLWTVTRPFFMDPFEVLAKWKIVVPMYYTGPVAHAVPLPGRQYWGDRELSPLEKVAAHTLLDQWGHRGSKWVDDMMWVCKDLQIDGIINFNMLGCPATLGLKKLVEDAADKELGIPTLQLEGREWDKNYADEAAITARLDEFAQLCLSQRGFI